MTGADLMRTKSLPYPDGSRQQSVWSACCVLDTSHPDCSVRRDADGVAGGVPIAVHRGWEFL